MAWETAIVMGMTGLAFLFLIMSKILDDKLKVIKIILFFGSFLLGGGSLVIIQIIAAANDTAIGNLLGKVIVAYFGVFTAMFLFFVIQFIIDMIFQNKRMGRLI